MDAMLTLATTAPGPTTTLAALLGPVASAAALAALVTLAVLLLGLWREGRERRLVGMRGTEPEARPADVRDAA
jgi:hypothetical protein